MWKIKLQTLCLIFDSRFGNFFPKMQNLPFTSQNIHLLFSPIIHIFSNAVINIVSLVWLSSFLGVLWKARIPFEIDIYEGYENKCKCENTIFFPQIMAYADFERTGPLREEFLPECVILGELLNGSDPCFESKLK